MNLSQTLAQKPLFSASFDVNRMPRAYKICEKFLKIPPIIHVIGTNGKGSTGRFLALMLHSFGKNVGHYTSPHISVINERFWISGSEASDEALEEAHQYLQTVLPKEILDELSYFEYTTFLAVIVFKDCDTIILEAGLGGEWDATNVFPKALTIVTPIGLDHQDFLGESIEEIASTKLRSITTTTILAPNQPPEVIEIAKKIAFEREVSLVNTFLLNEKTIQEMDKYTKKYSYPDFLQENLKLAYSAARLLHVKPNMDTLSPLDLHARFEWFAHNVLLDCGHNPLAASVLVSALGDGKFSFIYNAYEDKDVESVIKILLPKIESLHVIPMIDKGRKSAHEKIKTIAQQFGIEVKEFDFKLNPHKNYVVFGSFGVIEAFMKGMNA